MNKTTVAVSEEDYKRIIETMKNGFVFHDVHHKPNIRIATVLMLEYNLGLRLGDILHLTIRSFVKDGERCRLDVKEEKTGKERRFTVPDVIYQFVRDYAYENSIHPEARLFPITERAVLKHLKAACNYLNIEGVGSHSFRKAYATRAYEASGFNIELVRTLLQHSSVTITQRYIGIGSRELEETIEKNILLL